MKTGLLNQNLVSIIVPVYNVEKYIDQCVESIINQTYENIEILLINDGSTDNSYELCELWGKKDLRIRIINKVNEGLAETRNLGVKEAKGNWIAFVDSDDWIDEKYIEEMLNKAIDENADLVVCAYYRIDENTGVVEKFGNNSSIGISYSKEQELIYVKDGMPMQLCKKRLIVDNGLEQPNCKSQDFAIKLLMCVVADKFVTLDIPLYYYRKNRSGAITTAKKTNRLDTAYAAEYLINGFKKKKMFKKYNYILFKHELNTLAQALMESWRIENKSRYEIIKNGYLDVIKRNFEFYSDKTIVHIGSFNLMHVIRILPFLQDINNSFQFSSIISIMNPCNRQEIIHKNIFRKKMIEKDISSDFLEYLKNGKFDCIIMDFLEERHDIYYSENGVITKSDAFNQIIFDTREFILIKNGSDKWFDLWKKNFINFIDIIKQKIGLNQFILVRNKLVEEYGTIHEKLKYKDIMYIREKNEIINKCYNFVEENYPEIKIIDPTENSYYFTDINYEYGLFPWHLNVMMNEFIAKCIEKNIVDGGDIIE